MAAQREWFEKDYYKMLGVPETATAKEITKAYRKLARELHPDTNPGNAAAEERFKAVSAAYDVLGDETKRASTTRSAGSARWARPAAVAAAASRFNIDDCRAPAASATCSARCSAAAAAGRRRGGRASGRGAAPTSRPS